MGPDFSGLSVSFEMQSALYDSLDRSSLLVEEVKSLRKSELRNHAETRDLRAQRDAIPVAAIVRYWRNSNYDARRANANGYTTEMFDDDNALIEEWVNAMENVQHE